MSSPVWSMLGPVLRVGVPLDWICHLEPVSSDVHLQKDGSLAQPKSQANHTKSANRLMKCQDHQRITYFIILLITKGEIVKSSGLYPNNDLGAYHDMSAGYTLGPHSLIFISDKH